MHYKVRAVLVGLLFCSAALGADDAVCSKGWKTLYEKNSKLGLTGERIDHALGRCRNSGMTLQETDMLLYPVSIARSESLPVESMLNKIEEGLAKRVDAKQLAVALEARLENLRRAARLIPSSRPGGGGNPQRLITQVCMALESGLPEAVLKELFEHLGGFRYGRLVHVVEMGETLQLAGLDPQNTKQIMDDCLSRQLNRSEMVRVVDYLLEEHRKGRAFKTIHSELWIHSK